MKQVVAFAVVAGLVVGQAAPAAACTVVIGNERYEPTRQDRARYREECRQLRIQRRANLHAVARGEIGTSEVFNLAERYESTEYGCPGDDAFAFDLMVAAVPDPVPLNADIWLLQRIEQRAVLQGHRLPAARLADLRGKYWLLRTDHQGLQTSLQQQQFDIAALLADPANMALALDRFGDNSNRDNALIGQVSDPASGLFNRAIFAQLALRAMQFEQFTSSTQQRLIQAAHLLLDPQWGEPDFDTAQRLLMAGNIGPFYHVDPAADELAASLWWQIGQHQTRSGDPAIRASGERLLETGDPLHGIRTANPALPANAEYLPEWPAQFGEIISWDRALPRIAQNYPVRAIRNEESGPVETAVHYGRDGQLVGFVVLRSSGSAAIDERATEVWRRYIRPQPPQTLPADMVTGQDLLIRMPRLEYHLSRTAIETATRQPDGRIIVTASLRGHGESYSDCL